MTPEELAEVERSVMRSENALGVAGHLANIGETASWDVEWVAVVGLGRTTADVLDDTSADSSHVGSNVKGKYAFQTTTRTRPSSRKTSATSSSQGQCLRVQTPYVAGLFIVQQPEGV